MGVSSVPDQCQRENAVERERGRGGLEGRRGEGRWWRGGGCLNEWVEGNERKVGKKWLAGLVWFGGVDNSSAKSELGFYMEKRGLRGRRRESRQVEADPQTPPKGTNYLGCLRDAK